jgi:hypothetical protein
MTTTEHLQLIKAECERLLAIAEKRTQGEWVSEGNWIGQEHAAIAQTTHYLCESDATFIAACAGRAEAGWRATIAAIDYAETVKFNTGHLVNIILTAWPIELLKP